MLFRSQGDSPNRPLGRWPLVLSVVLLLSAPILAADESPPDLSGTWAMVQFMPEVANLPFLGETLITAVVGVLVRVEQDGNDVTMHDTYCRTEVLSDETLLASEITGSVISSLQPDARTARLERSEGEWQLLQDWHVEVRGAILENPHTDPLPVGPYDPRVVDMDGDGVPGFTVPVVALGLIAGDTHVIQRLRYRIISHSIESNRVEGAIEWTSEQTVIGATDLMLMMPFEQWHDPDPTQHRFIMQRLDDDAPCDEVNEILEQLLPTPDSLPIPDDSPAPDNPDGG